MSSMRNFFATSTVFAFSPRDIAPLNLQNVDESPVESVLVPTINGNWLARVNLLPILDAQRD